MWPALEEIPAPAAAARGTAPRARAKSARSRTRTAPPSPRTSPSRPVSKGREAPAGSSLRVDSTVICANAASGSGSTQASAPPATTTSARSSRIRSMAMAMASAPEEQALTGVRAPARAPSSMLTQAAGPLAISMGTAKGDTRRGPAWRSTCSWASSEDTPPMPVPMTTASRSGSTAGRPACSHACRALISAICAHRSRRRTSIRDSACAGSVCSCAAMRTGRSWAQSCPIAVTPERPASIASQVEDASAPSGVVAPRPVTRISSRAALAGMCGPFYCCISGCRHDHPSSRRARERRPSSSRDQLSMLCGSHHRCHRI